MFGFPQVSFGFGYYAITCVQSRQPLGVSDRHLFCLAVWCMTVVGIKLVVKDQYNSNLDSIGKILDGHMDEGLWTQHHRSHFMLFFHSSFNIKVASPIRL